MNGDEEGHQQILQIIRANYHLEHKPFKHFIIGLFFFCIFLFCSFEYIIIMKGGIV